ncbi:MAG: hypothetical protein BGO70_13975 [Bacteroidetes bacterium 43-93]|nr:hypothetical protein [Bacteroidota bacterium]OJW99538.1 MAG: hypothetical protein BGO70_13975 [Bacteroidetes bacterium 43-93]
MKLILRSYYLLFILFILLENYFLLFSHKEGMGQTENSVLYFLVSLSIGVLIFARYYKKDIVSASATTANKKWNILVILLTVTGIILAGTEAWKVINQYPIDAHYSDIIPSIQVMVQRLLHGNEPVYAPIYDFGYLFSPTYLPMQWLPFTIAEVLHVDYRWIPFATWAITYFIVVFRTFRSDNLLLKLLVPIFFYLTYHYINVQENNFIRCTVESMVIGYYILLIISLNETSWLLWGTIIAACLLSRFSLLLWLPLWAFAIFISGNRKDLYKSIGLVFVLTMLVYVIPFLSKDWHSFRAGYEHYNRATIGEWQNLNPMGEPNQLYAGTGFAHIFYHHFHQGDVPAQIALVKKVHFIVSLGVSMLMGVWYWYNRKKIDLRIFLIASFKIYLTFFLAFIQIPYVYLMTVGNFVSIAILAELMRYKVSPKPTY